MKLIHKKHLFNWIWFSIVLLAVYFLGYEFVFADTPEYSPLVHLPGITGKASSLPELINTIYKTTIGIGALLGVIKIAFAGVKYSMSDVITDKSSAKTDIFGVLLGLAILLMPYVVLNTIYPGLLNLDFISGIEKHSVGLREVGDVDDRYKFNDKGVTTVNDEGLTLYRCECGYFESEANCEKRCKEKAANLSNFDRFGEAAPFFEKYDAWDSKTCNIGYYAKEGGGTPSDPDDPVYTNETVSAECGSQYVSHSEANEEGFDKQCENICIAKAKKKGGYIDKVSLKVDQHTSGDSVYRKCTLEYKKKVNE